MKWQTQTDNNGENYDRINNKWSVITAAVSFGKQNPSTTSPQEVWRVLVSLHHAVRIARENHMWTNVNILLLHKGHKGKWNGKHKQKTTEKTTTESTTSDQWSQQQSALVSRIQVQLRHKKSEGSLFLCIMLSELRGRITCEQLWTSFCCIRVTRANEMANANRQQRRKLRQNQQQVITAAVSFGKQNPSTTSPQEVWRVLVSLHHAA